MTIYRAAELSPDRRFRFRLSRWWNPGEAPKRVAFLMFNPSTADAGADDQTIRKCMGFAGRWGYNGIDVINLYPLRSRDPRAMLDSRAALEEIDTNLDYIRVVGRDASALVCAWGCEDVTRRITNFNNHILRVIENARLAARWSPSCLGLTLGGSPRHPVMLGYDTKLVGFEVTA